MPRTCKGPLFLIVKHPQFGVVKIQKKRSNKFQVETFFTPPLGCSVCFPSLSRSFSLAFRSKKAGAGRFGASRYTWVCFSGDFLFLALLKHLLGNIFFIFSRLLKQIQVIVMT